MRRVAKATAIEMIREALQGGPLAMKDLRFATGLSSDQLRRALVPMVACGAVGMTGDRSSAMWVLSEKEAGR